MTARRRWPGAGVVAAAAGWCVVAVLGPGTAGAEGTPLRSAPPGTAGAEGTPLPSAPPVTRPVVDTIGTVTATAAPAGAAASSAPVAPPGTVGTATPTSEPVRTDDRRPVGSVLRILIAGFLVVAAGLAVATWWYVRATRPVAGRRTV